jgi:hypothetical protein
MLHLFGEKKMERYISIGDNTFNVFFDLVPLEKHEQGFGFGRYVIEIQDIHLNESWIDTDGLYIREGKHYTSMEEAITTRLYEMLKDESEGEI